MRRIILILSICIILLAIAFTPYLYGWYAERNYYQNIEQLNLSMRDKDSIVIRIDSYDRGWFTSTAKLIITSPKVEALVPNMKANDLSAVRVQSIIHHGPFIHDNGKFTFGFALIETTLQLPTFLQSVLLNVSNADVNFATIKTLVLKSGDKWSSELIIKPINFKNFGNWDGLTANINVDINDNRISHISSQANYGATNINLDSLMAVPRIYISPIKLSYDATLSSDQKSIKSNAILTLDKVNLNQNGQAIFDLSSFTYNLTDNYMDPIYSCDAKAIINDIKLEATETLNQYSNMLLTIKVKNFNLRNYLILMKSYSPGMQIDKNKILLSLLTKQSTLDLGLKFNSNLGPVNTDVKFSLKDVPKDEMDFSAKSIIAINMNVAHEFAVNSLLSQLNKPRRTSDGMIDFSRPQVSADEVKQMLSGLVNIGYIVDQNNQYVISLQIENNMVSINNMAPVDMQSAAMNIIKAISPPPAVVQPAIVAPKSAPVQTTPATQIEESTDSGFGCYWLDPGSDKKEWTLTIVNKKSDCYALDSCHGGLGKDGNCYKWAKTADGEGEGW